MYEVYSHQVPGLYLLNQNYRTDFTQIYIFWNHNSRVSSCNGSGYSAGPGQIVPRGYSAVSGQIVPRGYSAGLGWMAIKHLQAIWPD